MKEYQQIILDGYEFKYVEVSSKLDFYHYCESHLFYKSLDDNYYFCHVKGYRDYEFFGLIKPQIGDEKCIFVGYAYGHLFVITNGFIYSTPVRKFEFCVIKPNYKTMLLTMEKYFKDFCKNVYYAKDESDNSD